MQQFSERPRASTAAMEAPDSSVWTYARERLQLAFGIGYRARCQTPSFPRRKQRGSLNVFCAQMTSSHGTAAQKTRARSAPPAQWTPCRIASLATRRIEPLLPCGRWQQRQGAWAFAQGIVCVRICIRLISSGKRIVLCWIERDILLHVALHSLSVAPNATLQARLEAAAKRRL
jgi:hypothetical protein